MNFYVKRPKIQGVYVPSLYDVSYNADGTVKNIENKATAPKRVKKRIISDLDKVYYPDRFVVPFIDVVHDRAVCEIFSRMYSRLQILSGRVYLSPDS